jgi:hypothetical protein
VHTGFWWGNLRKTILPGRYGRQREDDNKIDLQEITLV